MPNFVATDCIGAPRLGSDKEHDAGSFGLGHLLNPTDPNTDDRAWIRQPWEHILAIHLTDTLPSQPPQRSAPTPASSISMTLDPEPKSIGSDGLPCHRATLGILRRRPLAVGTTVRIGKEANRIEERESGELTHNELDAAVTTYRDERKQPWVTAVLPQLRKLMRGEVAAAEASPHDAPATLCLDPHHRDRASASPVVAGG